MWELEDEVNFDHAYNKPGKNYKYYLQTFI